jgi:hypothetical protein
MSAQSSSRSLPTGWPGLLCELAIDHPLEP